MSSVECVNVIAYFSVEEGDFVFVVGSWLVKVVVVELSVAFVHVELKGKYDNGSPLVSRFNDNIFVSAKFSKCSFVSVCYVLVNMGCCGC